MSKNRNNRRCAAISIVVFWCVFIIAGIASAAEIQLAWNPPTTNSDGTPITDLAGYRIYYSTVSGSYPQYVDVGNRTTYTITNLAPGTTYYFVATAYNTAGGESGYSNMVAKTTPAAPQQYSLTVNKSGTGTGTVTGTGINCGTDCTEPYNQGTVVTLSAAPATGSTFAGWSGNCTGTGTCTVTMNAATTITATFNITPATTYSITASAGSGGTITPSGTVSVTQGASGTFTITPDAGYLIADVKVDGVSVGAVNTYTFSNVTAHHSIAASFAATTPPPPAPPQATTITAYEDAQDGTIKGWDIYDNDPAGAKITNVYDTARQSRVIQLSGAGRANGYRLRNDDYTPWNNTSQSVIEWSMKYAEDFTIYIDVETTAGHRYLTYTPVSYSNRGTGEYVHYGLGTGARNGVWQTFTRDLQADLKAAQPGVTILSVNGFLIRGSGLLDGIKLMKAATVYEDAQDGTIKGWDIYDNDPAGAKITNVYDTARQSRVIQLSGSGTANGYRLRSDAAAPWNNTSQFVIEWSMKYSSDFTIYIDVETTAGHRYLTYTPVSYSNRGTGEYVHYGLGTGARNGVWQTFTRDLQADLKAAQPGVTILSVNGFLIRGSGMVDEIKLKSAF